METSHKVILLTAQTLGTWSRSHLEALGLDEIFDKADFFARSEEARQCGFEVRPDSDQPGIFYFVDPHGNYSDISYASETEAWETVFAEMADYQCDEGDMPYSNNPTETQAPVADSGQTATRDTLFNNLIRLHPEAMSLLACGIRMIDQEKLDYEKDDKMYFDNPSSVPEQVSIADMIKALDGLCEIAIDNVDITFNQHHTLRVLLALLASLKTNGFSLFEQVAMSKVRR